MTSVRHLHLSLVSSCILEKLVFLDMARNGGYNVVPVETVGRRYQCQICLLILRDPVQLSECGHRFCKLCMDDHVKK